jgi:hypothetical protein
MALQIKNTSAQDRHLFTGLVVSILNIIDDNLGQALNDGDYLKVMNALKELHKFKNLIYNDAVFQLLNRARQQNRAVHIPPSLLEKSEDVNYECCKKCNRFIKITYMEQHLENAVCLQSDEAKHTTLIKKAKISDLHIKTQVLGRAISQMVPSHIKWAQQQEELEAEEI